MSKMLNVEKEWDFICDEFKRCHHLDINHLWFISGLSKEVFVLSSIYTRDFMCIVLKERTQYMPGWMLAVLKKIGYNGKIQFSTVLPDNTILVLSTSEKPTSDMNTERIHAENCDKGSTVSLKIAMVRDKKVISEIDDYPYVAGNYANNPFLATMLIQWIWKEAKKENPDITKINELFSVSTWGTVSSPVRQVEIADVFMKEHNLDIQHNGFEKHGLGGLKYNGHR